MFGGDRSGGSDAGTQSTYTVGIDVSHYQGEVNWPAVAEAGVRFAFIKATEGTSYKDPNFNANYVNAYNAGVIRGAYHFARPNISAGSTQANYLASNGGAWSADSRTLPAALDLEGNPYSGGYCYGLSTTGMRNWVQDFLNTYRSRTGRYAVTSATRHSTGTPRWLASSRPRSTATGEKSTAVGS